MYRNTNDARSQLTRPSARHLLPRLLKRTPPTNQNPQLPRHLRRHPLRPPLHRNGLLRRPPHLRLLLQTLLPETLPLKPHRRTRLRILRPSTKVQRRPSRHKSHHGLLQPLGRRQSKCPRLPMALCRLQAQASGLQLRSSESRHDERLHWTCILWHWRSSDRTAGTCCSNPIRPRTRRHSRHRPRRRRSRGLAALLCAAGSKT